MAMQKWCDICDTRIPDGEPYFSSSVVQAPSTPYREYDRKATYYENGRSIQIETSVDMQCAKCAQRTSRTTRKLEKAEGKDS